MLSRKELRRLLVDVGESDSASRSDAAPWLIVAAHPDDETIGASWLLRRIQNVVVLHLTDGAPRDPALRSPRAPSDREGYALLRHEEARHALALAGIPDTRIRRLDRVDQEASQDLASLTQAVLRVIEQVEPAVVVAQPYEGGHPDHDAAAFAVQVALRRLQRTREVSPILLEMTSYHRYRGAFRSGAFLPAPVLATERVLSAEERALKAEMLACFASQTEVLAGFSLERERYRAAPAYDFRAPPVDEPLHYEVLGWPMRGASWRAQAELALVRLEQTG
ncbi:MAG: hypothetical protein JWN48_2617 [Myxococcaceae bacterium]|nr:hypothetical protein [Myxococcaceae bacterium]